MEGYSITATQKDALHGNSRTLSSITMLLVVLVQLGFGFLEVSNWVRVICIVSEHSLIRYCARSAI